MTSAPKITRPTYIDARPPAEVLPPLADAAGQVAGQARQVVRAAPGSSLIGATLLGATAAYFIPKAFDWLFDTLRSRDLADELEDDDDQLEDDAPWPR